MTLYINACVRTDSRTDRLAKELLEAMCDYEEINLEKANPKPLTKETLELRTALIAKGDYSHPMFDFAKQFAAADTIVISAPFWDLSFPSSLKAYIENIYVTGLVSKYSPDGKPIGLCKAEKLYYVTTAGGPYDRRYSYDYIRDLAETCFGIRETHLIYAEMLDVDGFDAEDILKNSVKRI